MVLRYSCWMLLKSSLVGALHLSVPSTVTFGQSVTGSWNLDPTEKPTEQFGIGMFYGTERGPQTYTFPIFPSPQHTQDVFSFPVPVSSGQIRFEAWQIPTGIDFIVAFLSADNAPFKKIGASTPITATSSRQTSSSEPTSLSKLLNSSTPSSSSPILGPDKTMQSINTLTSKDSSGQVPDIITVIFQSIDQYLRDKITSSLTTTHSNTQTAASSSNARASSMHLGMILGIVFGTLSFLVLFIFLLLYLRKRQRWTKRQVVKTRRKSGSLFLGKEQAPDTYTESTWNESSLGPFDSVSQAYIGIQRNPARTKSMTVSNALSEETEKTVSADSMATDPQDKSSVSDNSTQVESQTTSEKAGYGMNLEKMDVHYGEENMDHLSVSSITIGPRTGKSKNPNLPMIIMTTATPTPPSTVITIPY